MYRCHRPRVQGGTVEWARARARARQECSNGKEGGARPPRPQPPSSAPQSYERRKEKPGHFDKVALSTGATQCRRGHLLVGRGHGGKSRVPAATVGSPQRGIKCSCAGVRQVPPQGLAKEEAGGGGGPGTREGAGCTPSPALRCPPGHRVGKPTCDCKGKKKATR